MLKWSLRYEPPTARIAQHQRLEPPPLAQAGVVLAGERMVEPYVCTIPAVPPSFNVYNRLHWAQKRKQRDEWGWMLQALLSEKGNRCPRGLDRVELRAVVQFTQARRRDSDNYSMPLWKWTQDALVRLGIIPDDTHERCHSLPPKLVTGDKEQTVLIVIPRGE